MDSIRVEMATIRASQDLITHQLAQLLSLHTQPPPRPPSDPLGRISWPLFSFSFGQ